MKRKLKLIAAIVFVACLNSCIADLNERVDELEDRVSVLVKSVSDIEALVKSQVYVKEVQEIPGGHRLVLSNNESFPIMDGAEGKPGVSVVEGIAGIKSVTIDEDYVIFNLEDGGRLALPRRPKSINIEFTSCELGVYSGKATFKVTDALDPYVIVSGDSDMSFEVSDIVDGTGTVSFNAGAKSSTKLVATLIDNASAGANTNTKVLKINFETRNYNALLDRATIASEGGRLSFSFSTNVDYELEFPDWMRRVETKSVKEYSIEVSVDANDTDCAREAAVNVLDAVKGDVIGTFTVRQRGRFNDLYLLNEGTMGMNNASLTRIDPAGWAVTNYWFSTVNGTSLGDTGNDLALTDDYLIIALNGSNIIQFCDRSGKAIAQTEDVKNCRRMAVDPEQKYLYVTSYADDGYVAKIDLSSFKLVSKCKVGYEPEGIVWYGGKLYVANTGGQAYLGTHGYEQTISVVDAQTMKELKRVDTGLVNLYGSFVQNDRYPRYVLANSCGDYYETPAASFVFDCESESVVDYFEGPATYATSYNGKFYSLGSEFSYSTNAYVYYLRTLDMITGSPEVTDGIVSAELGDAIKSQTAPYGIFAAPDGEIFISDAGNFVNHGGLSRFDAKGRFQTKYQAGVCPSHFVAD